jgi:two-component system NtrC family response regulator
VATILIIDDDRLVRDALALQVAAMQHTSFVAETLGEGIELFSTVPFDIVFLDVHLPDGDGLQALPAIRKAPSMPEVIIITGEGSAKCAEMAFESGAWDYIQKPLSKQEIRLQLTRALDYRCSKMQRQPSSLVSLKRDHIIGSSPELIARLELAAQCAASDVNVLITGETGTGKESFAKLIHRNSLAPESNFIVVDCAALPEPLVESVLFGHVKGAFTGADGDRKGLIQQADGGTLFLDEVGELPISIQKKFLRVLQERRFKPVGGTREVQSKFRLISATNRNLDEMVAQGRFREDLLYRLRTFHIDLPPLRLCQEDIKNLAVHYIDHLCWHHGLETKTFVPEFMTVLESYHWPGNIRELINTLEKAILADRYAPKLFPMHLPAAIRMIGIQSALNQKSATHGEKTGPPASMDADTVLSIPLRFSQPLPSLKQLRDQVTGQIEARYLTHLMLSSANDLDNACKVSGLSKPRIYALLKKHSIPRT